MTTKRQAEICVERNLSDQEIVDMTGCQPGCVEFVRAWGRGECVQFFFRASNPKDGKWGVIPDTDDRLFQDAERHRIAPRRIHVKATLPDGTEREASFPEPVRDIGNGDTYWITEAGIGVPSKETWEGKSREVAALEQGRIFRTRADAVERDNALIWISGGETDQ